MFAESGFPYVPHPERVPNTRLALELGEAARARGLHSTYHEAVMQGMWDEGRDVADPAVLREIGLACGLDDGEIAQALEGRHYREAVDLSTREAQTAGINAVPAFVFAERFLVLGAQPHDALERVVAALDEEEPEDDTPVA
jgi:predicted DsbA family dithiol-disulfide isomerase